MTESIIETPIGGLFLQTTDRGIRILSFVDVTRRVPPLAAGSDAEPSTPDRAIPNGGSVHRDLATEAERQITEYFAGTRTRFDLPLDLAGTEFRRRVWQAIAAIPFGETASYAEVALSAGAPNAYRAAGSACGANPVVLIVPCHRVIGSDKGLHGFGGGLDTKVWLLQHEALACRQGLPQA